jgi:hypothetical protein
VTWRQGLFDLRFSLPVAWCPREGEALVWHRSAHSHSLLVSCGSSSPSSAGTKDASTTAGGVPQSLHVAQGSYGPKPGMHIVGSLYSVMVDQLGAASFRLWISNKGTSSYDCAPIQATQIPTKCASESVGLQNPYHAPALATRSLQEPGRRSGSTCQATATHRRTSSCCRMARTWAEWCGVLLAVLLFRNLVWDLC